VATPVPVIPVVAQPTISGKALALAIRQRSLPDETTLGFGIRPESTVVHAQQLMFNGRSPIDAPGVYSLISRGWNNSDTRPRFDLAPLAITTAYIPRTDRVFDDGMSFGAELQANDTKLARSAPYAVVPESTVALNQTLAQWDAAPWFVQLQVQTDASTETVFRLCFHVKLPNVIRLSCGKFDRTTGQLRGVFVADDSQGMGSLSWVTQ